MIHTVCKRIEAIRLRNKIKESRTAGNDTEF